MILEVLAVFGAMPLAAGRGVALLSNPSRWQAYLAARLPFATADDLWGDVLDIPRDVHRTAHLLWLRSAKPCCHHAPRLAAAAKTAPLETD